MKPTKNTAMPTKGGNQPNSTGRVPNDTTLRDCPMSDPQAQNTRLDYKKMYQEDAREAQAFRQFLCNKMPRKHFSQKLLTSIREKIKNS